MSKHVPILIYRPNSSRTYQIVASPYRRWIQGTFQKAEVSPPPSALPLDDGVSRQLEACTINSKEQLSANLSDTAPLDGMACSPSVQGSVGKEALAANGKPGSWGSSAAGDETERSGIVRLESDGESAHPQSTSSLTSDLVEATGFSSGGDNGETERKGEAKSETEAGTGIRLEGESDATEDDGGPSLGELFSTPLEYEVIGCAFGRRFDFLVYLGKSRAGRVVLHALRGPF